jgi:hypothetical protein
VALTRRASRAVPVGAALLAVGMQVAGLYSVLSRSWLPVYDGRGRAARYGDALDGILDYAPWPSAVPLTAFALTGLAVVAVLVLAVRLAVVGEREPSPRPSSSRGLLEDDGAAAVDHDAVLGVPAHGACQRPGLGLPAPGGELLGSSEWSTRSISCSMIGPSSRSAVT